MSVVPVLIVILGTMLILTAAMMAFMIGLVLSRELTDEQFESIYLLDQASKRDKFKTFGVIYDYSWLVSINIHRYMDLPESLEFFCAGVIISHNRVMTGNGCLKEDFTEEDFRHAIIRSHSAYFFDSKLIHRVTYVIPANDDLPKPYMHIYILQVKPSFPDHSIIPSLITRPATDVASEVLKKGGRLILTGWGDSQLITKWTLKHDPFYVEEWYPGYMVSCKRNLCYKSTQQNSECCNKAFLDQVGHASDFVNGKALVGIRRSGKPVLLALEVDHMFKGNYTTQKDLTIFLDLGQPDFVHWIKKVLPSMFSKSEQYCKQDNGYQKLVLYSKMLSDIYMLHMENYKDYVKKRQSIENREYFNVTVSLKVAW